MPGTMFFTGGIGRKSAKFGELSVDISRITPYNILCIAIVEQPVGIKI